MVLLRVAKQGRHGRLSSQKVPWIVLMRGCFNLDGFKINAVLDSNEAHCFQGLLVPGGPVHLLRILTAIRELILYSFSMYLNVAAIFGSSRCSER